jgi:hypothetical protein
MRTAARTFLALTALIATLPLPAWGQRDARFESALARAQDYLSPQGRQFLLEHFVPHREPCESIARAGGNIWVVEYADGFRVMNVTRTCRGVAELLEYFTGQSAGDCDAQYIGPDGRYHNACFPRDAGPLVRSHGQIVSILILQYVPAS